MAPVIRKLPAHDVAPCATRQPLLAFLLDRLPAHQVHRGHDPLPVLTLCHPERIREQERGISGRVERTPAHHVPHLVGLRIPDALEEPMATQGHLLLEAPRPRFGRRVADHVIEPLVGGGDIWLRHTRHDDLAQLPGLTRLQRHRLLCGALMLRHEIRHRRQEKLHEVVFLVVQEIRGREGCSRSDVLAIPFLGGIPRDAQNRTAITSLDHHQRHGDLELVGRPALV